MAILPSHVAEIHFFYYYHLLKQVVFKDYLSLEAVFFIIVGVAVSSLLSEIYISLNIRQK